MVFFTLHIFMKMMEILEEQEDQVVTGSQAAWLVDLQLALETRTILSSMST